MLDFYLRRRSIRSDKYYRLTLTQSENINIFGINYCLWSSNTTKQAFFCMESELANEDGQKSEHVYNIPHERGIVTLSSECRQCSAQGFLKLNCKTVHDEL